MSWWTNRRLFIALVSSLALNLFLAGMLVAVAFTYDSGRRHERGPFAFRAAAHMLDRDQRRDVRQVWRSHRQDVRTRFRDLRDARGRLAEVLTVGGDLDAAAVDAAFADVRRRSDGVQQALQDLMRDIAARLPPDARQRFFERAIRHRARH